MFLADLLNEESVLSRSMAYVGITLIISLVVYTATKHETPYDAIPAIGYTGFFSSYITAWRYIKQGESILQEGYDKYKSSVFRIAGTNKWNVIVSGEKLIEELRKVPEDVLSAHEALQEMWFAFNALSCAFALNYMLGPNVTTDVYHIPILRGQLTRNLRNIFPQIQDELVRAIGEYVPTADDWVPVDAVEMVRKVVARASNRIFVGAPTCRDPEYIALTIGITMDVAIGSQTIKFFPKFFQPLVGRYLTKIQKTIRTALKHLQPIIEERKRKIIEFDRDYPDKPVDVLSWLIDDAKGDEKATRNLTLRILALNFAAIHTTSNTFTHALYHIATRPEYVRPMREEIEAVIAEEGWSKDALSRMHKLDSFLKESQRVSSVMGTSMMRKAMQPYTFSDGTTVPKGARISAVAVMRQRDPAVWSRGDEFDGFRFLGDDGQTQSQLTTTSTDLLVFGHGRAACPGRWFAATLMKTMMAHLLLTYDMKTNPEGVRPEDIWFTDFRMPNQEAKVLFRRRDA